MEPLKKRKKREHYKKYFNPGAKFFVPRSTDSSARLRMADAEAKSQPDSVSCNLNLDDSITTRQECSAKASAAPVGAHCMESQGDRAAYAIYLGFSCTNVRERDLRGNIDLVGHNQDAQDQASEKKEDFSQPDAQHEDSGQEENFSEPDAQDKESGQEEDLMQPYMHKRKSQS
ncbi:uncharacterized protein LOC125941911 [Dermacentor silvarum]|uniref:uncharacterized protein LOC125941911 n=1 Tax=Dermacentor silvarum TaxID=543639 RepID=UPI0021017E80|nr:uncharacterized protein LOC125941911 [Dermacentor silvarum]